MVKLAIEETSLSTNCNNIRHLARSIAIENEIIRRLRREQFGYGRVLNRSRLSQRALQLLRNIDAFPREGFHPRHIEKGLVLSRPGRQISADQHVAIGESYCRRIFAKQIKDISSTLPPGDGHK